MFKSFSQSLSPRARVGLVAGALAIVLGTAALATWMLRSDYQVLFADLKPQDAATMVAELDRLKQPYKLANDGSTILVDSHAVHATRLKLMGKDMPLHGAAGFELFNGGDFGMTEFAQKINYQRALQGEITRTILSLSQVRDARVHLALPEEGLFKRANSAPKAAITLSLKPGQALRPEQISGIQRLVAAAVPGVLAQDVTIIDQQGAALTRTARQEPDVELSASGLELKRDTEMLLERKAREVLENAFGPGQAMASVDVTLAMDQVKVTTEDVIGTPTRPGQSATGVMVRVREVSRELGSPLAGAQDAAGRASNSQREVEYQVGRRVEQVVTRPGAIRRLQVAAVIRQPLTPDQIEQTRTLLAAAVGGVVERGDSFVVQSLQIAQPTALAEAVTDLSKATAPETAGTGAATPAAKTATADALRQSEPEAPQRLIIATLSALMLALLLVLWAIWRRPRQPTAPLLTTQERRLMASQMKQWLDAAPLDAAAPPTPHAGPTARAQVQP